MGFFSKILDKLRHHASPDATAGGSSAAPTRPVGPSTGGTGGAPAGGGASGGGASGSIQNVDIEAVLKNLAAKKGGGGNYKESIVDLLKLLDLDSSLEDRKELAQELGVNAGPHGSAEQNIALHQAVMRKVAENGGKVPETMKH
jgi:Domain of unknown function (DUF3597)